MNIEQFYLEDSWQYLFSIIVFSNFYLIENLDQNCKKAN